MKLIKLLLSVTFVLMFNVHFSVAQQIDTHNQVEYLEEEGGAIEDLNSIKALAKKIKKKKKVVVAKKIIVKEELSLEDFVRKVSKRSKSLRYNKRRKEVGKCFKETTEEEPCGSEEDEK